MALNGADGRSGALAEESRPGTTAGTAPAARRSLFYGWVVVAGAFVSHLLNYGTLTVAFGVFFPFMAEALHLSRGVLASAGAVARLVSAAIGPILGPVVDRRGPRLFMALGVVSLAGGALVLGIAHRTWEVFLG